MNWKKKKKNKGKRGLNKIAYLIVLFALLSKHIFYFVAKGISVCEHVCTSVYVYMSI